MPRISAPDYIDSIFELAQAQNIGLIPPTIDTELLKLADARARFAAAGIQIVVADSALIRQCRDKRDTIALFERHGITSPAIYTPYNIDFPLLCQAIRRQPRHRCASAQHPEALTDELKNDPKMMFCQLIDIQHTFKEFTVDMYYNHEGRLKCAVPRERLEVRSGEVSKGATRRDWLYDFLLEKMAVLEGARGCITAQFFYHAQSRQCVRRGNQPALRRRLSAHLCRRCTLSGLAYPRISLW